eukprot:CAMPEP_0170549430 /NCGR_PEP_ID=MMETSP0211-20121228/7588_1 /TAXON_ID=311385 /ORGANISM="Pseudokeronopsis sp., Strain OXSARD2" /LENGTH=74 /DNA_ID=CAMNT_0010855435 /DNA_START=56 /DNA_END=280 /DNA_ORIENTATION=-
MSRGQVQFEVSLRKYKPVSGFIAESPWKCAPTLKFTSSPLNDNAYKSTEYRLNSMKHNEASRNPQKVNSFLDYD